LLQFATDAPFVLALGQATDQRVAPFFGEGIEEGEEVALFFAGVAGDLLGEDLHLGVEGAVFRPELGQLCEQPLHDLVLLADVVGSLKAHGFILLGEDGHYNFHNPSTGAIVSEAADIEALLKAHGLTVPPNVDRVIQMIPMLLPLLGIQ
jgi:hypothetical protein